MIILLFVAAISCFTLQNICFKQFSSQYMKNATSYFMFNAIYFTIICALYVIAGVNFSLFDLAMVSLGLLFAISFVSAMFFYMKAMEHGPLGLSFLFFSAGLLMPVAFGIIFYGDPAPPHKFVGLVILAVAFYISTRGGDKKRNRRESSQLNADSNKVSRKWIVYILLGSLGNGAIGIAIKLCRIVISEEALIEFLFLGFGQAAIISLGIGCFLIWRFRSSISHFRAFPFALVALGAAVSTAAGNYATVALSLRISALVQFPIVSGFLVITAILTSRIVYKEPVTKRHMVTIVTGLIGIILLSL